jgi:hypothetical protein
MANPFTGGLIEKYVRVSERPEGLIAAIRVLGGAPDSRRPIRDAIKLADLEFKRRLCLIPIITTHATVSYLWTEKDPRRDLKAKIEYGKDPATEVERGDRFYRDFYKFCSSVGEGIEIHVTRRGDSPLSKRPVSVEVFDGRRRVSSYYNLTRIE